MMRNTKSFALILSIICACTFGVASSKKEKGASKSSGVVDSGSFGVFVKGQRVATETFNVEQNAEGSSTKSEFKVEDGSRPPLSSEWQLTSTGDLRHYEWKDGTGKSQTTVDPQEQILHQQITVSTEPKPITREYLLPPSTPILDDYAFVQREVLTWRFLATGCQKSDKGLSCKAPGQFGVLVPQQQTSLPITIEFKGMETVTLKGQAKEMGRFDIKAENMDWRMWMDGYKLVRILIPADNTEVVRD
jgi:hypothetical protein